MKNFDWEGVAISILLFFTIVLLVYVSFTSIEKLANIDVNAPPTQVCIQSVTYFEETLTPVYDARSLNPMICERGVK